MSWSLTSETDKVLTKEWTPARSHRASSAQVAAKGASAGKAAKPKQLRTSLRRYTSLTNEQGHVPRTEKTLPKLEEQAILMYLTVFKSLFI
jgi:hypothetical protein